jgi:hypothetical protein
MAELSLFMAAFLLGGIGGLLGSIAGSLIGGIWLFVGGLLGGLLIAPVTGALAVWRRWISPAQYRPTTVGAAVGFIAAAGVAVSTLSSPVGPILGSSLTGVGALIGSRFRR